MLETPSGFDNPEDRRFDCHDLPIDLFEPLSVLALQERERQVFSAVPGCGAVLHESLAGDVELPEFEQGFASARSRLELQHRPHASEHRRVQAIGLRQLAGGLGEAARLTRVDLGERNAGRAERALDGAMVRPGRLEYHAICGRLRQPCNERFVTALVVGEASGGAIG